MKKLPIFILLVATSLQSCDKDEIVDGFIIDCRTRIVSDCVDRIEYFINNEKTTEQYPFLKEHFKSENDISAFAKIDSAIVYSKSNNYVVSLKGDPSGRNILLKSNYKNNNIHGVINQNNYDYFIDSTYFENEKYVNPCLQEEPFDDFFRLLMW